MNKEFFSECYNKLVVPKIEKINKELSIVKHLDAEIEKLIYERSLVLESAEETGLELCDTRKTMMFDAEKLKKEYTDKGFRSEYVRDIVALIRNVFFDDTKEEFRKYSCAFITFGDIYSYIIRFEFTDDSDCSIGISMQNRVLTENDTGYSCCSPGKYYLSHDEQKYLYNNEFIDGKISFYIRYSARRYQRETIAYSFNIYDIAHAVSEFVLRDKSVTPADYEKYEYPHYSLSDVVFDRMNLSFRSLDRY